MAEPALRRATYADLFDVPGHLVAELINGQLITSPRPAKAHSRAASSLGSELHGPFDRGRGGPGGWIILDEPELRLSGDALAPDIMGWRRERMLELLRAERSPGVPRTVSVSSSWAHRSRNRSLAAWRASPDVER